MTPLGSQYLFYTEELIRKREKSRRGD